MHPVHLIANLFKTALDCVCMDENCGDEDQSELQEEGHNKGSAAKGAIVTTEAREGIAAKDKEKDGAERLGPAVRASGGVVVGRSKADKHSIAYLDGLNGIRRE